jgi:hypothetical protein
MNSSLVKPEFNTLTEASLSQYTNRIADYLSRWNLDKKYRQLFEQSVNIKNFQEIKITDEFFRFFLYLVIKFYRIYTTSATEQEDVFSN